MKSSEKQEVATTKAQQLSTSSPRLDKSEKIALTQELAVMFAGLAHKSGGSADMKLVLQVYLADLDEFPLALTRSVLAEFRRGDLGDGHWAPTVAEIRQVLKNRIVPRKIDIGSMYPMPENNLRRAVEKWRENPQSWAPQWGDPPNENSRIKRWLTEVGETMTAKNPEFT